MAFYRLHCNYCGNSRVSDGKNEILGHSRVIPKRADGICQDTFKGRPNIKCEKCGRFFDIRDTESLVPTKEKPNEDFVIKPKADPWDKVEKNLGI